MVDGVLALKQNLRDRYNAVALPDQVLQDGGQRLGRMLARVMEQDNRAVRHLARDAFGDLGRRDALPVEAIHVPNNSKRLRRKGLRICQVGYIAADFDPLAST